MSCCPSLPWGDAPESIAERAWLAVERGDAAAFLDLDSFEIVHLEGRAVVPLAALWRAADLGGAISDLLFHFEGEDGFRTRDESDVGMPALLLDHAFVDPITRDLVWTIEVPAFCEVRGLSAITVQHASEVEVTIAAE